MKSSKPNPKRVLAIDPTSRGFGFVVIESPSTVVEWAIKTLRKQDQDRILAKVSKLIRHYLPEIIVLEDHQGSRRGERIKSLLDEMVRLAAKEHVKSRSFPMARVKKVFGAFRATNKLEIAHAVAQQLPVLAHLLPPPRKPWMSEDYHMAIFDAAALALTYFNSRLIRGDGETKPVPESAAEPLKTSEPA